MATLTIRLPDEKHVRLKVRQTQFDIQKIDETTCCCSR